MRSRFHGYMTMTPKRTGRAPSHGKDRATSANANITERSANLLETSFSITDAASPCSLSSTNNSRFVRERNDNAASRVSAFSLWRGGSCDTTTAPESAARLTSNSTPVTAWSRTERANAASEFSSPPAAQPRCAMRCMRRYPDARANCHSIVRTGQGGFKTPTERSRDKVLRRGNWREGNNRSAVQCTAHAIVDLLRFGGELRTPFKSYD